MNNEYHYSKNKKAYNSILSLYNAIDFLIKDFKTSEKEFENILLGLEKFINAICLAELNNFKSIQK